VSRDQAWLTTAAFLRATAVGMIGVLLGGYLAVLGLPPDQLSWIVGAGLAGATVAILLVPRAAAHLGHKRFLCLLALFSGAGALLLALSSSPTALAISAFIGMVNGMGRDRGAGLVMEQALLPATTDQEGRTAAFARYNVLQDLGHAAGGLLAGAPIIIAKVIDVTSETAHRAAIATYGLLSLAPLLAYAALAPELGGTRGSSAVALSSSSRRILRRISALFALDSLGGGLLTTALLSYFFHARFGVGLEVAGPLFFVARLANAVSHLVAAWLSRRIGLVNTMVFTHIPSSLLLVAMALAPSFPVAAALFLVREVLVEMDVPTRQSYVMAVVAPHERATASAVTHVVRLAAWAIGPLLGGLLLARAPLVASVFAGAAIKILYDLLLYLAFRGLRTPEEVSRDSLTKRES
jgi:MFS family permease